MNEVIQVPLKDIVLDPRLQMRASMDITVIDEYADNLFDLPPSKIVQGPAGEMWLTSGWHRYHAHAKQNQKTMPCTVREGTFMDALTEAAGENHGHGIRRTHDDKRRAVAALLGEKVWQERSNRMIAQACHVGDQLVAKVRENVEGAFSRTQGNPTNPPATRTGKDGKPYPATQPKAVIICERCQRTGAVKDCPRCAEARGEKRKPKEPPDFGEDDTITTTGQSDADETVHDNGKKKKAVKPPKPGEPIWKRDKEWEKIYGALVRFVTERAKSTGKGPTPPSKTLKLHGNCHDIMMELLSEFIEVFTTWKKGT